ncbi:unnamed protein product [Musa banksii]
MRKKVIPIRCSPVTEPECGEDRVAEGYVPVVVGLGKELRRFVVSVGAFKHPCFVGQRKGKEKEKEESITHYCNQFKVMEKMSTNRLRNHNDMYTKGMHFPADPDWFVS